ncbi:lipoprotein [Tanticharoenia sakaeratensis]|jgi:LPS-assembly lipoprotein|uniref:Lipoprotein n=1 Tax=Tanticharoenia sakaeratensis NBRC 103193 TaxID=1231623 RepID=A0A0D6MIX1_9PROT|nr:lipoprotein [Tanticharoenia sakaeratensis]GAN53577.1 hypothetical protein Tasa_010_124 [Tanticharoenia sakaeratensis NBRC 103193]GBQ17504.1 hypothetical protein AA103193_0363 [Tanticharoenia sakaeratensis NBRC 103193]
MRALRWFGLLAPLGLAGCGFQPLYGHQGATRPDVASELTRVYVANIPNRYGQELRLALQQELGGASQTEPDGYTLQVSSSASEQAIDIHSDNTSGRMRVEGHAHWSLFSVSPSPALLAQGDAVTLDGYSPTFEQLFAQTLDDENVQKRVAETLAGTIRQQVAIWISSHVKPPVETPSGAPGYVDPTALPTANGPPVEKAGPDGFPASATGRLDPSQNGDDQ